MSIVTLTLVDSKLTKQGNYFNKLVNKQEVKVETAFGDSTQERKSTYYTFTSSPNEIGKTGQLDLGKSDIVEEDYETEIDGEIKVIPLKKLYPKR